MRGPKPIKSESVNGEIHFIFQEGSTRESAYNKKCDEAEAIRITKKEASKPLLLLREE